jgi:hypothetical protein
MTILLRDHIALALAQRKLASNAAQIEQARELYGEKFSENGEISPNFNFPQPQPKKAPMRPFFHDDPILAKFLSADMERRRIQSDNAQKVCRAIARDDVQAPIKFITAKRDNPIIPMTPAEQEAFLKIREVNRNVLSESTIRANAEQRARRLAKANAKFTELALDYAEAMKKALNAE